MNTQVGIKTISCFNYLQDDTMTDTNNDHFTQGFKCIHEIIFNKWACDDKVINKTVAMCT